MKATSQPRLTIVIPTRERSDTLRSSMLSILNQNFDSVQLLVSDNASKDSTRDVVHDFKDERIEYINTGRRISMASNWEFALSRASGTYVTFLGDDDGFLPESLTTINSLLLKFNADSLVWLKGTYVWPGAVRSNTLIVHRERGFYKVNNQLARWLLCQGLTSWTLLPNLYSGFIRRSSIAAATPAGSLRRRGPSAERRPRCPAAAAPPPARRERSGPRRL